MPEDLLSWNSTPLLLGNTQRAFVLNTAIPRRSVYWSLIISNKDVKSETKWKHQSHVYYIYIYITVCVCIHIVSWYIYKCCFYPQFYLDIFPQRRSDPAGLTLASPPRSLAGAGLGLGWGKISFVIFIGKPLFLRGKKSKNIGEGSMVSLKWKLGTSLKWIGLTWGKEIFQWFSMDWMKIG